jgi:dihydroxyacetone kinase-like predicted kinase
MVGYDPGGEPTEVAQDMREISSGLQHAEVTRAARGAWVEGREVRKGSYMGILNGTLEVAEETARSAALKLAERMLEGDADILTLLWGAELDEEEAERIAEGIRRLDPDVVVEVKYGGQPLYPVEMVAE